MNLFEIYSDEIKTIVKKNRNFFNLNDKNSINNIIVENPPEKFDYDFSSNAAMILAKNINQNPRNIVHPQVIKRKFILPSCKVCSYGRMFFPVVFIGT